MALTRDDVVEAAVRLLGEAGLDGLTLRRLARDLGVSAPTLYWHVTDKRALLDLVAERLLADQWQATSPAPGQPWWAWLRERSLTQYRVLVAHRDAALVVAGNRPTPERLPAVEEVMGSVVDAGFAPLEAFETIMAVGHYVLGAAVEYHAEAARPVDVGQHPEPDPVARPHLAAIVGGMARGGADHETMFLHGLDLMLDGARARVAQDRSDVGDVSGSPTEEAVTSAT